MTGTRRAKTQARSRATDRRTSSGRGQASQGGWESLTKSELRVVRLVAQGLTNREAASRLHLSPHTVDSHLRHSFAKLGVRTRVELTREVVYRDSLNHEPK